MPAISKISAKGQTTIPQEVRVALKTRPGDLLAWEVAPDGRVAVRPIQPIELEWQLAIQGTLNEWDTVEDEEAYREL